MRWWAIVVGAAVVLFTLRQVFQDLFHPAETGSVSEFVARLMFRLFRRSRLLLKDAGPLSLVFVICIWATLICFGFALIYWGLPSESFGYRDGSPPDSLRFSSREAVFEKIRSLSGISTWARASGRS
jgi:hypothetical protein